jgi:RND family efflux transporter MFP subunit
MNSWLAYTLLFLTGVTFFGPPSGSESNLSSTEANMPGIVKPSMQVSLHPNIPGVLRELSVKEGQAVKAGETLAIFDDRLALANLTAAEVAAAQTGQVELARAELDAALKMLKRFESVSDPRAVAAQEVEAARADVEKAQANLETAEGNIRLAAEKLAIERERCNLLTMTAPFDGIVHRLKANPGERLLEDQIVMEIVNVTMLKVEIHLPSKLLSELVVGEAYSLQTEFRNLGKLDANLVSISPVVDPSTDTIRCIFEIDNSETRLPAGFIVQFNGK